MTTSTAGTNAIRNPTLCERGNRNASLNIASASTLPMATTAQKSVRRRPALGASAFAVGFIEGVAESTAMITKIFSGALSDRLGKRKVLAMAGYALAAAMKPVFALAASVGVLAAARFIDRIGKAVTRAVSPTSWAGE
jgi:MFS family permease